MVIFSHVLLPIESADCPEAPRIAKFIGKVTSVPSVNNNGLRLSVTVSDYIRKGERPVREVIVTHPTTGRLSKSITAAQKNATDQFAGILIIYEGPLIRISYIILFVGIRSDDLVHSYNPWSTKNTTTTKSSVAKNYTKSKCPRLQQQYRRRYKRRLQEAEERSLKK